MSKISLRQFDPRLYAYDAARRVAEESLREYAPANWLFVTFWSAWAMRARVSLRAAPSWDAPQITEAVLGEEVEVLERREDGWQWLRTKHDRYLGWARVEFFSRTPPAYDHLTVHVPRAHAYAGPNITEPILAEVTWGAKLPRAEGQRLTITNGRTWTPVLLPNNALAWMASVCLAPDLADNPADFALRCLDVPYILGGRTALGLDCGGLSQLAYAAAGRKIPRDADLQQMTLRTTRAPQKGDLAFFPGHVGIMLDNKRMIHANSRHMRVSIQTLGEGENGQRLQQLCQGFGKWEGPETPESIASPAEEQTDGAIIHEIDITLADPVDSVDSVDLEDSGDSDDSHSLYDSSSSTSSHQSLDRSDQQKLSEEVPEVPEVEASEMPSDTANQSTTATSKNTGTRSTPKRERAPRTPRTSTQRATQRSTQRATKAAKSLAKDDANDSSSNLSESPKRKSRTSDPQNTGQNSGRNTGQNTQQNTGREKPSTDDDC